jgi:hypothetical protein
MLEEMYQMFFELACILYDMTDVQTILIPNNALNVLRIIPGRNCKRRSVGLRLGRNSCPISALSGFHHCDSQQGVYTDSWEICTGVQRYNVECKNSNRSAYYYTVALVTSCHLAYLIKLSPPETHPCAERRSELLSVGVLKFVISLQPQWELFGVTSRYSMNRVLAKQGSCRNCHVKLTKQLPGVSVLNKKTILKYVNCFEYQFQFLPLTLI